MYKELISKTYIITTPSGEVLVIKNLAEYCRENNLNYGSMMAVKNPNKPNRTHKGYVVTNDGEA